VRHIIRNVAALLAVILMLSGIGAGPASQGDGAGLASGLPERGRYLRFKAHVAQLFQDMGLEGDVDPGVFEAAMVGYYNLIRKGDVPRDSIMTIIDYTKPSADERFLVLDLRAKEVLYRSLVAHGVNSGDDCAESFSNEPGSLQTSLGFYITGEEYEGAHGKAMRLTGVDTTFNDNAEERCIVVHGAWYCTGDFVEEYGRLGRSWGCPVLPPDVAPEIIEAIKGGTCLFAYYDDDDYLEHSVNMDVEAAADEFAARGRTGR
jgi:hypothetical protein